MPESLTKQTAPERVAIDTLLPYLLKCPEASVKALIARNLGTGVFYDDPDEVLYWAAVQIAFCGKPIRQDLLSEVIDRLTRLARETAEKKPYPSD
jgi:hypothetical protein